MSCVVFTPANAPEAKQNAIRRHGAILHSRLRGLRHGGAAGAANIAGAEGGVYISPYNHPDVIAGAGTIGLEIVEAMPDLDVVVIPLGGGGLASGMGLAVKAAAPQGDHRRRGGRGLDAIHAEPRSRPHHRDHAAGIDRRRPRRQPRAGIDDVRAGEAGRRFRRHGQRRRSRPGDEGTGDRGTADRRRRRRRGGRGDHGRQGFRPGTATLSRMVTGGNVDLPKWLGTIN